MGAYDVVRKYFAPEDVKVVVDIAARGFSAFDNFMPDHHGDIDLDAHHYQCFGEANGWSELPDGWSRHLEEACRMREDIESSPLNTWSGSSRWLSQTANGTCREVSSLPMCHPSRLKRLATTTTRTSPPLPPSTSSSWQTSSSPRLTASRVARAGRCGR